MSFDILSPHEPLDSCLFIEASAGTGKTFVIEHYVVRLLLSSNLSMRQLVLITFTKAVARELRRRLAKAISEAASVLHSGEGSAAYLEPYVTLSPEDRRRYVIRLDEAASLLPQATITTIHGFCDTLLALYADQKGVYIERSYMSGAEQRGWITEFLRRTPNLSNDQWRAVAKKMRYSERLLLDRLVEAIDGGCERGPDAPDMFQEVQKAFQGIDVAKTLMSAATCFRGTMRRDKTLKPPVVEFLCSLEAVLINGPSEDALSKMFGHDFNGYFSIPLTKGRSLSHEEGFVLATIQEKIWPYIEQRINPDTLIRRLSADCTEAFASFMKKSGKKTPSLVVQQVKDLVKDEACRRCAAQNFSCVIVDEFQDTDDLQWQIIETLFVKNRDFHGRMLFVGDPKQAIYGFRKADVYNYLSVKDSFSKEYIRTLSVNHRAEEPMVLAQNILFCGPAQPWQFYLPAKDRYLSAPAASSTKKYPSSVTHDRKAVHFMVFEGELGRRRRWPHDMMETEQIFPWMADEIVRLHTQKVPLHEIAVLVKDRFQAKHLIDFLKQRNIPAVSWKVDSVLESPAYIWLQQALSLAAAPEDRHKLCSVYHTLRSDRFLQIAQKIAEGRLDLWAQAVQEWKAVQEAFNTRGIGGFSRALFRCLLDEQTTVFQHFSALENGDQFVTDIEHLLELLARIESSLPHSLEAFCEAFSDISEHFSDDPSIVLRRIDPASRGVNLVTMHSSKGLEFPYVFALGPASRSSINELENSREIDSEKFRLLYVSVTRAKNRCYLPIVIEKGGRNPDSGRASPMELLASSFLQEESPGNHWHSSLYEGVSKGSLEKLYRSLVEASPDIFSFSIATDSVGLALDPYPNRQENSCAAIPYAPIASSSVRYCSFTSSRKNIQILENHEKGFQDVPSVQFGILFHSVMAQLLLEPPKIRSSLSSIQEFLEKRHLQGIVPATMLYASVQASLPLHGEDICLADIPNDQMRVECSFVDLIENDRYYSGVIDLVIFRKGHVYVVDWKTGDVSQDCTRHFYEAGYDVQANMYLEAVKKAFCVKTAQAFFVFVRHLDSGGIVTCP